MKIAITTNDGLRMAPTLESAGSFLILTIILGEIVEEEIRLRHESDKSDIEDLYSQLSDCSLIVTRETGESMSRFFRDKSISIFRTNEEIITNVIVHYLEHEYREASDHCCCP